MMVNRKLEKAPNLEATKHNRQANFGNKVSQKMTHFKIHRKETPTLPNSLATHANQSATD